jgi:hypothetical protein
MKVKNFNKFINEGILTTLGLNGYEEGYFDGHSFNELKDIGFVGFKNNDCAMIYRPNIQDTLEYIAVINMRKELPGSQSEVKYIVKVHLVNNKVIKKTFTHIEDVVKFAKEYIPEIDSDIEKYNL